MEEQRPQYSLATKKCKMCGEVKPASEFHKSKMHKGGIRPHCKVCASLVARKTRDGNKEHYEQYSREYREAHPHLYRQYDLKRRYGISVRDYEKAYNEQGGNCLICGAHGDRLYVDHDHETGRVRGLLCRDCNLVLGYSRDCPDVLRAASRYLVGAMQ